MDENIQTMIGIIASLLLAVFICIGGYLLTDRHIWLKFLREHHCHLSEKKDTEVKLSNWGARRSSGFRKFRYPVYDYICDDGKKYETSWFYEEKE